MERILTCVGCPCQWWSILAVFLWVLPCFVWEMCCSERKQHVQRASGASCSPGSASELSSREVGAGQFSQEQRLPDAAGRSRDVVLGSALWGCS